MLVCSFTNIFLVSSFKFIVILSTCIRRNLYLVFKNDFVFVVAYSKHKVFSRYDIAFTVKFKNNHPSNENEDEDEEQNTTNATTAFDAIFIRKVKKKITEQQRITHKCWFLLYSCRCWGGICLASKSLGITQYNVMSPYNHRYLFFVCDGNGILKNLFDRFSAMIIMSRMVCMCVYTEDGIFHSEITSTH